MGQRSELLQRALAAFPQGDPCGASSSAGRRLTTTLHALGTLVQLKRGETMLHEEERDGFVCVVEQGLIKGIKRDSLGHEVLVRLAESGDILGLEALAGLSSGVTWRAILPSRLRIFTAEQARAALMEHPDLLLEIMSGVVCDLKAVEDRLLDFAHKSARKRAAETLLARSRPEGDEDGRRVVTHLTRQDLAAMAGMTSETFIRILSALRSQGIVRTEGRLITILDRERLSTIAGRLPAPPR